MFDATLRPLIDPPLKKLAERLDAFGVTPNGLSFAGLGIGLLAVPALWLQLYWLALLFILINRLFDGLDGAVARVWADKGTPNGPYGGFLDIAADFLFYGAVPLGFALADPAANALAASFLLFAFLGTGTSFLAFAILAEQRGLKTQARGKKSFYYLGGLAEGTETIVVFILMCLLPGWFAVLALVYGHICLLTVLIRYFEVQDRLR